MDKENIQRVWKKLLGKKRGERKCVVKVVMRKVLIKLVQNESLTISSML